MKTQFNLIGFLLLFSIMAPAIAFAGTSGPSPVPPPPNFQISTNTVTLCKGVVNSVPIVIKTPPGAAVMQSVQLSLANSRYAYTVGNCSVSALNVTANLTKVVPLSVFVSLNSTPLISAGIAINYQYLTLYSDSEVRNISFGIETCPSTLSVSVNQGVLTSGKIQNVTFNLTNTGNTTLNYISMHASLPSIDGTFLGIQPVQVRSIAPKSTVYLNEKAFIYSNATQSFPINLSISMYNGSSFEQISSNPIVLSRGIINITPSSITLSPSTPVPGSIFSISFVLIDVGTTKALAVTATAVTPKGFSSYGSDSVFVGDMQIDSQTPVTLTLTSEGTLKSGNYTIPVKLDYSNNLRENLSTTIYVPVKVSASTFNALSGNGQRRFTSSGSSGSGTLITVVLALVAIAFLLLFLRERGHHKRLKIKFGSIRKDGHSK
jgi:hypothetical protein